MAMDIQQERPPAYANTQPDRIVWPSIPQHLPHHVHAPTDITLPDLKTVLSPDFDQQLSPVQNGQSRHHASHSSDISVRSLPRIDPGYTSFNGIQLASDTGVLSPAESGSGIGSDGHARSTSIVSMDDPDVRIAAEALSGLGNLGVKRQTPHNESFASWMASADYTRTSPSNGAHALPRESLDSQTRASDQQAEQGPLLELIAQAHPWVGGTIKGSLSAYSTTKHYSPRIVQYGANLVERNITIPVVSAVSSVGEMTGVEHNLRRYLDSRRPSDIEASSGRETLLKRDGSGLLDNATKIDLHYLDASRTPDLRRDSIESRTEPLPRYGASRPPSYREIDPVLAAERSYQDLASRSRPLNNRSWSSQIFVTTSGLSIALSATSRRSLRFCLSLLGQSADRVSDLTTALSLILKEYEETRARHQESSASALEKGNRAPMTDQSESARYLAEAIKRHSDDIWQTLRYVVNSVSNYAGGALPENARQFVRQQLMSLPQRWRVVSDGQFGDSTDTSRSAQRMIDFAREGLDMMTQVGGVLKATLESAEKWLERVGRRDRREDGEEDQVMTDAPWQPDMQDEKS